MKHRPRTWRRGLVVAAVLSAGAMFVGGVPGCGPRSCEDAEDEYFYHLERCNIDYFTDDSIENECTETDRQFAECMNSCFRAHSCEATLFFEGEETSRELDACGVYCINLRLALWRQEYLEENPQ